MPKQDLNSEFLLCARVCSYCETTAWQLPSQLGGGYREVPLDLDLGMLLPPGYCGNAAQPKAWHLWEKCVHVLKREAGFLSRSTDVC
eukprot:651005-Rhodomonas_salina.1